MKPLVVRDQVRIGMMRCLALSFEGMSYRMFRSLITVSILALAVTFLIHMIAYGLIAHDTKLLAYRQLQGSRVLGEWTARLTLPDREVPVLDVLKAGNPKERAEEYRIWSGATPEAFAEAEGIALKTDEVWNYLQGLPVATRVALTSGLNAATPLETVIELGDPHQGELFRERLKQLGVHSPLGDIDVFEKFVRSGAPTLATVVRNIRDGQARAIDKIQARFPERDPRSLFAAPPGDFAAALAEAGFRISSTTFDQVSAQAKSAVDIEIIAHSLDDLQFKGSVARKMNLALAKTDLPALLNWVDSKARAEWLAGELARFSNAGALTPDHLLSLAESARREARLQQVVADEIPVERTGLLSLPPQTLWLIAVSFLVCVVGVANAMLMSVTERFTEIATMKCLGALDGFVTQVFFFEALLQGFFGGLAGIIAGVLLAVLRCLWEFGTLSLAAIPVTGILTGALAAWAVGVILAGAAAIGPVALAARLAPMEAMRVE